MSKYLPGMTVKVIDPTSKYFGQTGTIYSNYRSGLEAQAYGVRFDDGKEFWVRETDLEYVDAGSVLSYGDCPA